MPKSIANWMNTMKFTVEFFNWTVFIVSTYMRGPLSIYYAHWCIFTKFVWWNFFLFYQDTNPLNIAIFCDKTVIFCIFSLIGQNQKSIASMWYVVLNFGIMPIGTQKEGQNCYDRAGHDLIIGTFQQKPSYYYLIDQITRLQAKIGSSEHEPYTMFTTVSRYMPSYPYLHTCTDTVHRRKIFFC